MVTWLLGLLLLLGYLLYRLTYRGRVIPGPPTWPILGNLPSFWGRNHFVVLSEWSKEYGHVYEYYIFGTPFLVVAGKESLREAMVEKGDAFSGRIPWKGLQKPLPFRDIFNEAQSPFWKTMRVKTHKAMRLYGSGMNKFEDNIRDVIQGLTESMQAREGQDYDHYDDIYKAITAFIGTAITGDSIRKDDPLVSAIYDHIGEYPRELGAAHFRTQVNMVFPWLQYLGNPSQKFRRMLRSGSIYIWDNFLLPIKRRCVDPEDRECGLLHILHQEQQLKNSQENGSNKFYDGDMRVVITNIMIAGTLTTSTTLYIFLNLLLHHPDIQKKLAHEVDQVLGPQKTVSVFDKARMPYTRAVLLELLRFASIVPTGIPHMAIQDTTLAGYTVRKGTPVLLFLGNYHRNVDYWEKPDSFYPERFLDEDGNLLPATHPTRSQMLAFGAGPRVCLGEQLATNRLFMFMVSLVQRFTFCSPDGSNLVSCQPRDYKYATILSPLRYKMVVRSRACDALSKEERHKRLEE